MSFSFEQVFLTLLPKRLFTSLIGMFAKSKVSKYFISWFIRHYQIDFSEAEYEISQYKSLLDFFCRKLQFDARPISETGIISPVDGRVSEFGDVREGVLLQAKGSYYTLADLLGGAVEAEKYMGGTYITLYLSPRDYHRIHIPYTGICTRWHHIPGTLFPVNPLGVRNIPGLFAKNERVITHIETNLGGYCVVKVGAAGVGSVCTPYLPKRMKMKERARGNVSTGVLNLEKAKGEELGWFEFGSTVILIFEPGFISDFTVKLGQFVRMGEQIANVSRAFTE